MSQFLAPFIPQQFPFPGDSPGVLGPAGWHGSQDIQTLQGLNGTYLWLEHPGQWAFITFSSTYPPGAGVFGGTYSISMGGRVVEQGTFNAAPNNPITAIAIIFLTPMNPMNSRNIMVVGMLTDSSWRIQMMLLRRTSTGMTEPPFAAFRVG